MIIVTRPGGSVDRDDDEQITVNEKNINTVNSIPEDSDLEGNSKITMDNGDTIIVKETMEEVNRKIGENN
jgi:uncharacterized protein YlzI (FlbEa/FlbD family)